MTADGLADFKAELRSLNRELLFQFLDVLKSLIERPHASARGVENIGQLLRNMHYLLNLLRAHQARANLEHSLSVELADRQAAAEELRRDGSRTNGIIQQCLKEMNLQALI